MSDTQGIPRAVARPGRWRWLFYPLFGPLLGYLCLFWLSAIFAGESRQVGVIEMVSDAFAIPFVVLMAVPITFFFIYLVGGAQALVVGLSVALFGAICRRPCPFWLPVCAAAISALGLVGMIDLLNLVEGFLFRSAGEAGLFAISLATHMVPAALIWWVNWALDRLALA